MRKTVKSLAVITTLLLSFSAAAQIRISAPSAFSVDLKRIIASFPDRFSSYRGELIVQDPQSTDYQCTMKINGAESAVITTYPGKKETWSWEALVLSTEDFNKARQKFHSLFNDLNNLSVNGEFRLEGKYENPVEEKKFTSVIFSPSREKEGFVKMKVELLMQFVSPMEWKVRVMVYDREKEDMEGSEPKTY